MATQVKKKNTITKIQDVKMDKIKVFYRKSILKSVLKILVMEHGGFRTFKSVKNINKLFTHLDLSKYNNNEELKSYIWCISFISKHWLDGITNVDLILEGAKRQPEYDNIKDNIINQCMNDKNEITYPEAKGIFDLIGEALQYGFIGSLKDEYINLLEDINMESPNAFKEVVNRLFLISKSLIDIQYGTNMVSDKVTFNTADMSSIRNAIRMTQESLSSTNNMFKMGIRRWNTLLSPALMNGRFYLYAGPVGAGKSIILQKTATDIRKYNPDYQPKTPGMKPCVLYITMENFFTEVIERLWNMEFDESITNYSEEEAMNMICDTLGITQVLKEDVKVKDVDTDKPLEAQLIKKPKNKSNIEIVMKYFSYREISTDDLHTIIHDLREDNMEVCALVLDYVKRIAPATPTPDNEKLELNHIGNELKAIAVIYDIPVISAHQLNRVATSIIDNAERSGKTDSLKLVGKEHIGTAYELAEVSDWLGLCKISYKPGTNQRYLELNVVKRRRIDQAEAEFAKYTYLAHPFAPNNGMRLLDDINLDKVLSLQSLISDINTVGMEKTNAVPRLRTMEQSEFIELDEDY